MIHLHFSSSIISCVLASGWDGPHRSARLSGRGRTKGGLFMCYFGIVCILCEVYILRHWTAVPLVIVFGLLSAGWGWWDRTEGNARRKCKHLYPHFEQNKSLKFLEVPIIITLLNVRPTLLFPASVHIKSPYLLLIELIVPLCRNRELQFSISSFSRNTKVLTYATRTLTKYSISREITNNSISPEDVES